MSRDPIISVSGLRGIIGQSLDPVLAIRFATAFVSQIPDGPIVVSRDGRATGSMLADAICSGLVAAGRNAIYADVAATPTTGVLVREYKAAGGIQISASHNPPEYNGIKLFGVSGRVIPADEGEKVIAAYDGLRTGSSPAWKSHDGIGVRTLLDDTTGEHLHLVLDTVDVHRIRTRKFKVVLDSNHGAGSLLGRRLLTELGCEFQLVGDIPNGQFAHPPEPTESNLAGVAALAKQHGADVVFCQDPDADRLAIIDENGRYIGEEFTLAITLDHALSRNPGHVVTNCSSSRMSVDIAEKHNCPISLSAVGEANVTNLMIEKEAVYGGEGNGGPIDPRVGYVRDSFAAMAQVLDAMAANECAVSTLATRLPQYSIVKTKFQIDRAEVAGLYGRLKNQFPDAKVSELDGLRLDWPDRWLLVRPSNTEPIVRAIAESADAESAQALCDSVQSLVTAQAGPR